MLLLGLLALCLSYLLPGHYVPWVSFQQQWLAACGVALIVLGVAIGTGAGATRWTAAAWVSLATALVPLMQTLVGQVAYLSDGVLASLYVGGFGLCVVAGASCVGPRRSELLDGLCAAFIGAGIVSTGIAAHQWLQLGPNLYIADLAPGARPFANLAQPNHLATLLALGIAAVLRWYEGRRVGGWTALTTVAWLALGMLMTQSRSAWLFVGAVPIAWATLHRKAGLRVRAAPVAGGLLAFVLGVLLWDRVCEALLVSSQPLATRLLPGPRTLIWPMLVDAIGRAPWFGYGWNQVGLAQQAVALDHSPVHYLFSDGHNLFLDLMVWNGVPLGATLSVLLVLWFMRQMRACNDPDRWALLLALAAIFLHSMVEYPHDYAYFLLPAGLMVGALDGMEGMEGKPRAVQVPRTLLAVSAVSMLLILGWLGVEYMKVEEAARQLRFVKARIGLDRISFVPAPPVYLLDGLREAHRFELTEPRPGQSAAELKWMRTVAQHNATAPTLFSYALAAGLNGQPSRSAEALALLCNTNMPAKCTDGRIGWARLQGQYPQLGSIPFPPDADRAITSP